MTTPVSQWYSMFHGICTQQCELYIYICAYNSWDILYSRSRYHHLEYVKRMCLHLKVNWTVVWFMEWLTYSLSLRDLGKSWFCETTNGILLPVVFGINCLHDMEAFWLITYSFWKEIKISISFADQYVQTTICFNSTSYDVATHIFWFLMMTWKIGKQIFGLLSSHYV